ncbi:MAG: hypothetical protein AB1705_01855 [Verrucomicrobiota bacterium]
MFRKPKRRRRFSSNKLSGTATQKISSKVRRWDAVVSEMLAPLNKATYAATQAGHFGSSASVAPGTIHPASSPPRRQRAAGRRAWVSARGLSWQQS